MVHDELHFIFTRIYTIIPIDGLAAIPCIIFIKIDKYVKLYILKINFQYSRKIWKVL